MSKLLQKTDLKKAVVSGGGIVAGIAAGGALGNLVERYLPENRKLGKAGLVVLGGICYGLANGKKGEAGKALAMAGIGIAAKQAYDLTTEAIQPSIDVKAVADRSIADDLLYGAVGLGCPCGQNAPSLAAPAVPSIDFSSLTEELPEEPEPVASLMYANENQSVASLI